MEEAKSFSGEKRAEMTKEIKKKRRRVVSHK